MNKRVIFDIGHGSDTWPPSKGVNIPGGGSFAEHDFNSDVALLSKKIAHYNGFEVIFSQEPYSPDTPLNNRSSLANEEHKKSPVLCFISFHANASSNNPNATGHGVFHWHTSDKGKKLAQIWDKFASEDLQNGRWGSGIWVCQPGTWTNFHVVRATDMPAILLEHFFYTTFKELAECNTPEYKMKCAKVAVKTICEFAGVTYRDPLEETVVPVTPIQEEPIENVSDWAKEAWLKAKNMGLNDGVGAKNPVTEEQLMVFFDRLGLLK